jgi:hypothetical protein
MKLKALSMGAVLAVLVTSAAQAQVSGPANDPHHPAGAAPSSAAPEVGPTPDSNAGAQPMSPMCRQMMGHMVNNAVGGVAPPDSKGTAEMLQMRGEMMKAMGDIMMKHAHRMRSMSSK